MGLLVPGGLSDEILSCTVRKCKR